jgi:hypothetical protein
MRDQFVINYIINAHHHPGQLHRMVKKLNDSGCRFYIHIDKGVEIKPFVEEIEPHDNILFVPKEYREYTPWGGVGFVRATLNVLHLISRENQEGYSILLSGQDYPVKSNAYIRQYLTKHYGTSFINTFPLPDARWAMGGLPRLTHYRVDRSGRRGDFYSLPSIYSPQFYTAGTIRGVLALMISGRFRFLLSLLHRREFPKYLSPYGGSTWWAFPDETARQALSFLDDHPDLLAYHEHTHCPDEILFQSLIRQLGKEGRIKDIKDSLTYVNWERKGVPLPVTFSSGDYDELNKLGEHLLFARKFDVESDSRILDMIDRDIIPQW